VDKKRRYLDYRKDEATERMNSLRWLCINYMPSRFLRGLREFAEEGSGIGLSDYERFLFPCNILPWEPEYFGNQGVLLQLDDPMGKDDCAILLTNKEFYEEISLWSEEYVTLHPEDAEAVTELLEKLRERFGL